MPPRIPVAVRLETVHKRLDDESEVAAKVDEMVYYFVVLL